MSYWFVYWWTRLDTINGLLTGFMLLFGIAIVVFPFTATMIGDCTHGEASYFWKKGPFLKRIIILLCGVWLSCAIAKVLLPTTKEAAVIYLLPKIANSETAKEVEKIPVSLAKLLNGKMEDWLKDVGLGVEEKAKE